MDKSKKENRKASTEPPNGWSLDTDKYWRSFEYLSLEVMAVKFKTREASSSIIEKAVTPQTRDHGTDGYIRFGIKGDDREYTVEAKLRSHDKLGLRDIATSILYYLIGISDRHFIVTNVIFTGEALRVINELQSQMGRPLETVDGYELRRLLNEGLTCKEENAPELIRLLMAQPLPGRERVPLPEKSSYLVLEKHYRVPSRTELRETVSAQIELGERLFLVEGEQGTGKSRFIWEIARWAETKNYKICRVDMSKLYSPRIFVLDILQTVVGLDLNALLDCLDPSDREEAAENLSRLAGGVAGEYGRAVRYLLTKADDQEESALYLLRRLLSELMERCSGGRAGLLIIEGLSGSQREMIRYLLYVLDVLAGGGSRFAVVLELPMLRSQAELGNFSLEEWSVFARELRSVQINGRRPRIIRLKNYTELETRTLLENTLELRPLPLELESTIIARVGTNPGALFSAIELINRRRCFSRFDIERLPLASEMAPGALYLQTLLEDESSAGYLRRAFSIACDLNGSIPLSLNICLERELSATPGTLKRTGLFCESETEVRVQNSSTMDTMEQLIDLDMGTRQSARKWLLAHLDETGWTDAVKGGREYWLRLLLRQRVSDGEIEAARKGLEKADARKESDLLLLEAYRCRRDEKRFAQALDYILHYLGQRKFSDKLNIPQYAELLQDAERLAAELALSDVPVSRLQRIRLNTMRYWQCKTAYDYEGCERFTGRILEIEEEPMGEDERRTLERHFINARVFQALNRKERGDRLGCVRAFREAARRYPHDRELRISAYMNLAALFYHTAPGVSGAFLDGAAALIRETGGRKQSHPWSYNDRLLCDLLAGRGSLTAVVQARESADKRYSLSNLARCFNFEGFIYYERGEHLTAVSRFTKAAEIGMTEGGNKPGFLFMTNAISARLAFGMSAEDTNDELDWAFSWLMKHFGPIAERIARNRARSVDHMFAAVVSWVVSARAAKRRDLEDGFRRRWEALSGLPPYAVFEKSSLHRDFLRGDAVIVLF